MTIALDDRLAQALVDVADGLDLATTLTRILDAATELTGAQYGALGVLGPDDGLSQFLYKGMSAQQAAAVGSLPQGRGVLGELIRHPQPLRLAHLSQHDSATGFPPGHPPMDSFLGVPIRAGEAVFGNLYLTEKPGGFDAEDERRVLSLALAAGVAIRNAQLFEAAQVGGQWQAAAAEMANSVLRDEDGGMVLQMLVHRAREVARADIAILASPHDDQMLVEVFDSGADLSLADADAMCVAIQGHAADETPDALAACLDGVSRVMLTDVLVDAGAGPQAARVGCFPVTTDASSVGTLVLVWTDPLQAVSPDRLAAVEGMAVQAAVSLTLDVARLAEQKLLVFRDRDRIARDLHDLVVQRLFASGVSLQVLSRRHDLPDEARERVTQLITEMDATIAQIRDTIFELREGFSGTWQVTERLQEELDRMTEALGFAPTLQVDAELTTIDADDVIADSVAVVREALSNVARHAGATKASVRIWFHDGQYGIDVTDDGRGPGPSDRRSGLGSLTERAAARGGDCQLVPLPEGGSVLSWRVPLHVLPH